ncbi:hypothetical protein [Pseudotabrizicola sp. 4114]|uniref:hypothetical protein n=1 Tax=Pseudotabrizicola sp. 4114 TaxID=2817731 RepID=UPI00285B1A15|nr:hypothetical protein [Pseudorhodobacter sp. 4114]
MLLRNWVAAGLPSGEFWPITPGEITVILRGARDRIQREAEIAKRLVYAQAVLNSHAWHGPRRMPDFDRFFGTARAPGSARQTPEQMMNALRDWSAKVSAAGLPEVH